MRTVFPAVLLSLSLVTAFAARVTAAPTDSQAVRLEHPPPWSFGLDLAAGMPLATADERLLVAQGYGGARVAAMVSAARRVVQPLHAGVVGLAGFRTIRSTANGGATYQERFGAMGLELPVIWMLPARTRRPLPWMEIALVPWGGVGGGTASFHGRDAWQPAAAFGASTSITFRSRQAGVGGALGAYSLRLRPAGGAVPEREMGMVYLSVRGVFHAG